MTIVGTDAARTTLFQLEALAKVINLGGFEAAAANLGLRDKHRLVKAMSRLADNLRLDDLTDHLIEERHFLDDFRELSSAAVDVLGSVREFEGLARTLSTRTHVVRVLAYPTMVTLALAEAAHRFEAEVAGEPFERLVQFPSLDSTHRVGHGASLFQPLLDGDADVLAGSDHGVPADAPIERSDLYSWQIVAAVHRDHPLRDAIVSREGLPTVTIDAVAQYPLAVSPPDHETRDRLIEIEPAEGYKIVMESPSTEARVAMGKRGLRVPLIATDSVVNYDASWPVVVAGPRSEPVGHSYFIFWRAGRSERVQSQVDRFIELAKEEARPLTERTLQGA